MVLFFITLIVELSLYDLAGEHFLTDLDLYLGIKFGILSID